MARGPGDRFGLVDENIPGQRTFNRHAGLELPEEEVEVENVTDLTKEELQERLRALELPVSGNKSELVDRLLNATAE